MREVLTLGFGCRGKSGLTMLENSHFIGTCCLQRRNRGWQQPPAGRVLEAGSTSPMGASWSLAQGCLLRLAPGSCKFGGGRKGHRVTFLIAVPVLWPVAGSAELATVSGSAQ